MSVEPIIPTIDGNKISHQNVKITYALCIVLWIHKEGPLKITILIIQIFLVVTLLVGCSSEVAPPATTPTPLPIVVSDETSQPTLPQVNTESNPIDETEDPPTAETSQLLTEPVDEVVIDSLWSLRILDHDPVKGTITVRGFIKDGCLGITGWEQNVSDNSIFVRPILNQLEDEQCLDGQVSFDETIDLDVQELTATELIAGDYFLNVNGWTMPLAPAISSGLLQEEVTGCPAGGEGQILYFNEAAGFCLLFPDTFTMRDDEAPNVVSFYGPPLDEHTLEPLRAILTITYQESAQGWTLEQIANQRQASYDGTDRELITTPAFLDGQPAIQIEGEGEMTSMLQIITIHDDVIYAISVAPYDEFPQAAEDVNLVWDLALDSFKFIRPPVGQEEGQIISLDEFENLLQEAITSHNYDWLQALMDESFGFAFWRSQGYEATPEEAIEQLRLTYLQADHTITFEETLPDLSGGLGEDSDIFSVWNPATNPIGALFSTGWGPDGESEAFLIVTQSPDGILAWDGIILAHSEMGGFAGTGAGG